MRSKNLATIVVLLVLAGGVAAATPQHEMATQRDMVIEKGTVILAGVTLAKSTPIDHLLAAPDVHDGDLVQVEGTVVELCSAMGCWATLEDADGNRLNIKVEDGVVDLRELAETSHYMVAEGVFQVSGEHGTQIFIMEHGAVVLGE